MQQLVSTLNSGLQHGHDTIIRKNTGNNYTPFTLKYIKIICRVYKGKINYKRPRTFKM